MKGYIGLDIGGTKILGMLYDSSGIILASEKKKSKASEGLEIVLKQIYKVIDALFYEKECDIQGIGIGVPGIVTDIGVITFSPNLPFREFDLASVLSNKYGVKVAVGNDVNVAMYGEWKHQSRNAQKHILGLFVGTGVGGAIFIDGNLYTGKGAAGEFGHMVIQPDGAECGCGNRGCLEAYASKTAIQNYISQAIQKGRDTQLKKTLEESSILKSSNLAEAYLAKDPVAVEAVDRAARYLGIAIGSLINIFHPECIIIGGGVIEALGEKMLPLITAEIVNHSMPSLFQSVEISISQLGDEAGAYGAYRLIEAKF